MQDGKTDENHHESPPSTPGTSVSKFIPPTFPPLVSKPINQAARLEMYKHKHVQDMSSKLSKEISTLLAALPPRIPLDELVEAYKMQFGFDIPFREFGFSSSQDLIQSLWQTCNLDTKENELIVSAVASSHPLSADPAPFEEFANKSHPSIAPEIADRVRKLLLKWPSGMPISLLQPPGEYIPSKRDIIISYAKQVGVLVEQSSGGPQLCCSIPKRRLLL